MSLELRRATSAKSRKSVASLNFKGRFKQAGKKEEDDIKINDAFTTFQYKKEASGDSDEADTVFIFPRNWPEWSDYELNTEEWKNEDANDKLKDPSVDYYHDPEGVLLPRTQMRILDCWKRPHEVFQSPCILYDDTVPYIDVISANSHLLKSRCMRWVISSIAMVQKLAEDTPFKTEGENPQYTPNGGTPWRPWHHIYSLCKAGNVPHRPLINPSGKYIIRLYYLGCWRKIVVDDTLPFDSKGKMLLPATTIRGELWPMLLSKALLKIASHTWNKIEDPSGFYPIACLTGWVCEEFTNLEFDNFKLWKLISGVLEEKEGELVGEEPSAAEKPPSESSKKATKKEKSKKKEKLSKKASKSVKDNPEVPELPQKPPKPTEMLAVLSYWSEKYDASEVVQQIFPMKDPSPQVRNVSAYKKLKTINFPVLFQGYQEKSNKGGEISMNNDYPWKKNLQKLKIEKEKCVPECYVKAYSHFFGMMEEAVIAPEAEIRESPEEKDNQKDSKKKEHKGKKDQKEKKGKNPADSKKPGKGRAPVKNPVNLGRMMVDTGKWISFNSLTNLLEGITLIHKPASFKSHVQKPDFSRLLSPKISSASDNLDDIDEESEVCLDFAVEEKSYIYLDSAEEMDLIVGLFMLPTPTKLDENYSTAFDLMLNACEGNDEEYFNYNSSPFMCDTHVSYKKKNKDPLTSNEKYFEQWVEYNNEIFCELDGDNEQYILHDHLFLDKDALVVKISVDMVDDDNSEDNELECDEYELKLYKVGEIMKKSCEDTSNRYFDAQKHMPDSLYPALSSQSLLEKKNMLYSFSKAEPQINTYLLSNQLQSSKEHNFAEFEDIETFYGHPTMSHQPQSLRTSTFLGIELFRWDERNAGHPEMQFHVVNGKTIHFVLPPGRHLFQLLIRSASFHSLHMLSNVEIFHTNSKSDIFSVMKEDCAVLANHEKAVHQNFEKLISSLHNDGFSNAKRDLHSSYLPLCYGILQKDEKDLIHKESIVTSIISAFKESIRKIVIENISPSILDDVLWALKVVFLDTGLKNYGYKPEVTSEDDFKRNLSLRKDSKLKRKMTQPHKEEEAAKKIQRFFKCIMERKIFLCLQKDKEMISQNLDHLNILLKSNEHINVMRTMLNEEPTLKDTYGLVQDLGNEINVYEWKGLTLEINRDSWIPLVRYVFRWNSEQEVMSSVFLTCPLDHWVMTIIDNDSGQEIQRINNTCIPYSYKANERGYTLFIYGLDGLQSWSSVPWKINQIVPKSSPSLLICHNGLVSTDAEKLPKLRADTLFGYYIPNLQKRICSFLMKVKESSQISLCFNTSDRNVNFKFTLMNEKLDIIIGQEKEGLLVVPSIFLDGPVSEDEEYKVYTGEVILMNIWPLSDFQKKFAENQWIKDVAYSHTSSETFSSAQSKSLGRQTLLNSAAVGKVPRQSLMETKLKLGEPFIEPAISPDTYPATWRLEVLLNSPQEVVLEEIKQNGDDLRNTKKEWEEADPGLLQKNAQLYSTCETSGFTECLDYSKKLPTKFKSELPYIEEFHERESDDENASEIKPRVSSTREHRLSSAQRRLHRSKKRRKESEGKNEDNNTMTSRATNASLSEKGNESDEEADLDGLGLSSGSSDKKTLRYLPPENLIGHSCDISTDDIAGFHEIFDDAEKTINFYFLQSSLENNDALQQKDTHAKRKSTELSLYDPIYQDKSEYHLMREHLTDTNYSLAGDGDENLLKNLSASSGIGRLSHNAEQMTEMRSVPETLSQFENEDDKEIQVDHYKSYYIDYYDATPSTSSEESCGVSQGKMKKMAINDWVEIQSKMAHKQKCFKKKLLKLFTEVDSLVRAPFDKHLEKWNIYLANAWRSSEGAFSETEKPLETYRRAKKKLELARKERTKEDIKIIRILKGGTAKKGKKEKKDKPLKTKEIPSVNKLTESGANMEEGAGEKRNAKKKTKKAK